MRGTTRVDGFSIQSTPRERATAEPDKALQKLQLEARIADLKIQRYELNKELRDLILKLIELQKELAQARPVEQ